MQSRDNFYAEIDDSDGSSYFSYVGDINAYLSIDDWNKNNISFDACNAYE